MKSFDIKLLPYIAALFQAFQFAFAGSVYFGMAGWLIGGVGGIVVNLAVAVAASRISDIAKGRRMLAWTGLVVLLTFSPVAVSAASYLSMSVIPVMWLRVATAVVWAIIPDAAILLTGAIAGKSLVRDTESLGKSSSGAEQTGANRSNRSAKRSGRSATVSKSQANFPCCNAGTGCDRKFASQNAANAHARTCKFRPTIAMPSPEIMEKKQ